MTPLDESKQALTGDDHGRPPEAESSNQKPFGPNADDIGTSGAKSLGSGSKKPSSNQPGQTIPSSRSVWILFRKEATVSFRSAAIYMLVGLPLVLSVGMKFLIGGAEPKPAKLAIVGEKNPAVARLVKLAGKLGRKKKPFKLITVSSEAEGRKRLKRGKLHGLLVLPHDFDQQLAAGKHPAATLYFDESAGATAFTIKAILRELFRLQAGQREPATIKSVGIRRIPMWKALLPAFVVMVLLSSITLMPAGIATERQAKTLQAVLVAPVRLWHFVSGKALFGIATGAVGALLVLALNYSMQGNITLLVTVILLGAAVSTLLGLLVGLLVESAQAASAVASLLYVPLIWGAFFADLSGPVGSVSRLTPGYYMAKLIKDALFVGPRLSDALPALAALTGSMVLLAIACIWALRREEERT